MNKDRCTHQIGVLSRKTLMDERRQMDKGIGDARSSLGGRHEELTLSP